ncbi:MCE family protein [Mycobacterium koreense]|uniref:MCE family protein n=1 Tax=Mycolicibacillus koreensis TaxID=1069220 RepID=A0A7I7SHX0_9MYCO|nr:MCE family protein [Mycolicibacillus koreensis]MCV7247239.1 MCE family protein [Mycolicibacillus koreensis]ODR06666.1 mammalian cell entry protein [Mycolicibacillus koreensis]OSC34240.1 MCE family protein [Mycolicibacillus koreensis]BBY56428.1 mammalian cell entry protein [Mycolicibacillus koreensis]
MIEQRSAAVKFGVFGIVMMLVTAALFAIFAEYRSGSTIGYSAQFKDVSGLEPGNSVRIAGIRVGTVTDVTLEPDNTVLVHFDADQTVRLTEGTRAAVRYLNLIGDRYLELIDQPGTARTQPPGTTIAADRTESALDLDLLLGGLKPVIRGLDPEDVNSLTTALIQVLQGQSDDLESLFGRTSSFTNAIADNGQTVQRVIDHLNDTLSTIDVDGEKLSDGIDKLEQLVTGLAADRAPIGEAITALDNGTASLADLLAEGRPPLSGTVDQLNRLAPMLSDETSLARLDLTVQKAPANYRKLVRLGAYGSWLNLYICGVTLRVTDLQGRTAHFPWVIQNTGRCAEP